MDKNIDVYERLLRAELLLIEVLKAAGRPIDLNSNGAFDHLVSPWAVKGVYQHFGFTYPEMVKGNQVK